MTTPAMVEAAGVRPARVMFLAEDPVAMHHLSGMWCELHPDPGEPGLVVVHRGRPISALPSTVRQVALGARGWFDGEVFSTTGRRLVDALSRHEAARAELEGVATIVAPDALVSAVTAQVADADHRVTVTPWTRFAQQTHRSYLIQQLDRASARADRPGASAELIREAVGLPDPDNELAHALGRALATLQGQGGFSEITALSADLARLPESVQAAQGIEAIVRSSAISLGGPGQAGDGAAAAAAFAAADEARRSGRLTDAVRLVTVGLRLIFNGELHTDSEVSPLVDDPGAHLAPWRNSAFARYAYAAMAARTEAAEPDSGPEVDTDPDTDSDTETDQPAPAQQPPLTTSQEPSEGPESGGQAATITRVVVLRGAYGDFAGPVIELLRAKGADPQIFDPAKVGSVLTRHNVVEALVGQWLRRIDPKTWSALPPDRTAAAQVEALEAALAGADIVFADWCDPSAVFASLALPRHTRLVIRVHRVDAVRVWHQFVDWAAVSEVIFVAEHVRELFEAQISTPGAPAPTRMRVLNNVIDVARYRRPKSVGAQRRIALVGWARRVKDPLFALDVLEALLAHDPQWELHLIGRDFAESGPGPAREYAESFRRRASSAPLRGAIRWVGFTRRLEEALDECGFVLSTSRIEGWPVGVVEAAASGAVPVIREWPQLRELGAAARIYHATPDWVVDEPRHAAERILSYADATDWAAESARVRTAADRLCEVGDTEGGYAAAILGANVVPARPGPSGPDPSGLEPAS